MTDRIDVHLNLKRPYPIAEFYIMFSDYLKSWALARAKSAGMPIESIDRCKLYADYVGLKSDEVQRLISGDQITIPGQVLKDMRLRVTKDTIMVPQKREVLTRDI